MFQMDNQCHFVNVKKGATQRKMEVVGVSRDYLTKQRNEEDTHVFKSTFAS